MPNEGEVSFSLFGEGVDAAVLTREIGLTPTSIGTEHTRRATQTRWTFSLGRCDGGVLDVYEMASSLVIALAPHEERLLRVKAASGLEALLQVVLRLASGEAAAPVALGFDPDVVAFLGRVGAGVDVELDILPDFG